MTPVKNCPSSNQSPNLVTLVVIIHFLAITCFEKLTPQVKTKIVFLVSWHLGIWFKFVVFVRLPRQEIEIISGLKFDQNDLFCPSLLLLSPDCKRFQWRRNKSIRSRKWKIKQDCFRQRLWWREISIRFCLTRNLYEILPDQSVLFGDHSAVY